MNKKEVLLQYQLGKESARMAIDKASRNSSVTLTHLAYALIHMFSAMDALCENSEEV